MEIDRRSRFNLADATHAFTQTYTRCHSSPFETSLLKSLKKAGEYFHLLCSLARMIERSLQVFMLSSVKILSEFHPSQRNYLFSLTINLQQNPHLIIRDNIPFRVSIHMNHQRCNIILTQ